MDARPRKNSSSAAADALDCLPLCRQRGPPPRYDDRRYDERGPPRYEERERDRDYNDRYDSRGPPPSRYDDGPRNGGGGGDGGYGGGYGN